MTSVSSFFTNKWYHPNITVHPKCNITSFQAYNFAINLNELQSTLKAEISTTQQHYQKSANGWCSPASNFKVGNKFFVKAQFFWTTWFSKKLSKNTSDPIKSSSSLVLYYLPSVFQSPCVLFIQSSMFMLKPTTFNTFSKRIQLAPALVIIDRELEYEISQIVNSKINCWQVYKLLYRVIWLGYKDTEDKSK